MIEITAIITALVTAAKDTAMVTSAADKGAYRRSTIFPCIFEIIKEDDECEKDCWITCIEINPGAKKVIKETPSTSPLSVPKAKDRTSKNSNEEINGEKSVCAQTFKNLKVSF